MKHKCCWYCGKVIAESDASTEHFIPYALGGKINNEILHLACNNKLSKLDSELTTQLGHLAFLSGVENKRSKDKVFKGISSENEDVVFGLNKKILHEVFVSNPHGKVIKLTGSDIEELKSRAINKAKQIFPNDIDLHTKLKFKPLKKRNQLIYYSNGRTDKIGFSKIGGKDFYRAMCKIAIDFAVYWGVGINYLRDVIEFTINNDKPNFHARFYSPEYQVPYYPQPNEISHYITLFANEETGSIFCYIELFNVECCLIRLNKESYNGPSLTKSYHFNIANKTENETNETGISKNFEQYHTLFIDSFESGYIERTSTVEIQKRYNRFQKLTLPTVEGFIKFD